MLFFSFSFCCQRMKGFFSFVAFCGGFSRGFSFLLLLLVVSRLWQMRRIGFFSEFLFFSKRLSSLRWRWKQEGRKGENKCLPFLLYVYILTAKQAESLDRPRGQPTSHFFFLWWLCIFQMEEEEKYIYWGSGRGNNFRLNCISMRYHFLSTRRTFFNYGLMFLESKFSLRNVYGGGGWKKNEIGSTNVPS